MIQRVRVLGSRASGTLAVPTASIPSSNLRFVSTSPPPDRPIHRHMKHVPVSPTLAISELSAKLKRQGKSIYRFGLGQSPFPVFQPMIDALREHAPAKDYYATSGFEPLRSVVAEHVSARTGKRHSADDVLIGPGSKELIFLLQLCLDDGLTLLLPRPSWVSYAPQAILLGRRAFWVETSLSTDWKVTPATLNRALEHDSQFSHQNPRLLVLNAPSNPTGVTYTDEELEELAAVCKRHNVMVLSDEIYGRLTYRLSPAQQAINESRVASNRPGFAHASIARYLPESTIVLDGISKWAGAGGWRLGCFVFPQEMHWLRSAMVAAASETFSSVCAPVQNAAIPAFASEFEDPLADYLSTANRILRLVSSFHVSILQQAGAEVRLPHGGFYSFPDFSRCPAVSSGTVRTSPQIASDVLAKTGVAMLPGSAFGRLEAEPTFRLAFVDFDGEAAMRAIDTDDKWSQLEADWSSEPGPAQDLQREFLKTFARPVYDGTIRLADYLATPA